MYKQDPETHSNYMHTRILVESMMITSKRKFMPGICRDISLTGMAWLIGNATCTAMIYMMLYSLRYQLHTIIYIVYVHVYTCDSWHNAVYTPCSMRV